MRRMGGQDNGDLTVAMVPRVDRQMSRSCQATALQSATRPADTRGVPRCAGFGGPVEIRLEPSTISSASDARTGPTPGPASPGSVSRGPVSPGRYGAPTGGRAAVVGALLVLAVFG